MPTYFRKAGPGTAIPTWLLLFCLLPLCGWGQGKDSPARARKQPPERPSLRDMLGLGNYRELVTDSNAIVVLDSVLVTGNRITRRIAMLRELNVREGDTLKLADVPAILARNQQLLYNTSLFNKVEAYFEIVQRRLYLHFDVVERWYIWPEIQFRVEERTIWEWLESPNTFRTSYGAGLSHRNITGRNDRLGFLFQTGFNQRYSFSYDRPFVWPKEMIGMGIGGSFTESKEVIISGSELEEVPRVRITDGRVAQQAEGSISFRKRFTQNNGLNVGLGYQYLSVSDSVILRNSRYLSSENRLQDQYPRMTMELWWDSRDVRFFPLSGHRISMSGEVAGLGLGTTNFFRLDLRGFHYGRMPFKRFYWAGGGQLIWLAGERIPFPRKGYLSEAPVRGFERYVIDGTFFWNGRAELRYELLRRQIITIKWLPKAFRDFMTGVYPYVFYDAGYANDWSYSRTPNRFHDRLLQGMGFGVDIPYIYDNLLRLEVSRNNFGEAQFMLNMSVSLR